MSMPEIIAISGKARSGKTTAAKHLLTLIPNATIVSFAAAVRESAIRDFGLTMDDVLNGKNRVIRVRGEDTTIRRLLISIGNGARTLDQNHWVRIAMGKIGSLGPGACAIIDDLRFANEANTLRSAGATLVRIERPGIELIDDISETELDNHGFDFTVLNDGGLDGYLGKIEKLELML